MNASPLACGFTFDFTLRDKRNGQKVWRDTVKNRVPMEGLNAIANGYFKGGTGPGAFYIGLWAGAHVPDGTETAATLPSIVTEVTNYDGSTRKTFTSGTVANGGLSNAAELARFSFSGSATVNGAFISTTSAKGSTSGILLSVVRFPVQRSVDASVYLDVLAGFQLVSM